MGTAVNVFCWVPEGLGRFPSQGIQDFSLLIWWILWKVSCAFQPEMVSPTSKTHRCLNRPPMYDSLWIRHPEKGCRSRCGPGGYTVWKPHPAGSTCRLVTKQNTSLTAKWGDPHLIRICFSQILCTMRFFFLNYAGSFALWNSRENVFEFFVVRIVWRFKRRQFELYVTVASALTSFFYRFRTIRQRSPWDQHFHCKGSKDKRGFKEECVFSFLFPFSALTNQIAIWSKTIHWNPTQSFIYPVNSPLLVKKMQEGKVDQTWWNFRLFWK